MTQWKLITDIIFGTKRENLYHLINSDIQELFNLFYYFIYNNMMWIEDERRRR